MTDRPKLITIIKNDIGVFICVFLPIVLAAVAVGSFIHFESNRNNYSSSEILYLSPVIFISLSLCLWPFVLWWWHSINTTFKNGIELRATNTNRIIKYALGVGVIYTFEHEGNKLQHIASLVPNKRTRAIASMPLFDIILNPEKNISFIKDAYIE